jgi:CheY-like chemotaxis protein
MDDQEPILEVTGEILRAIGYEVDAARDGEEALQKYREAMVQGRPFSTVIMDLTIPGGMGGKEAIAQLLKMDPQARAIVSSGYSNDPIMANYREYGFVGVVPKPYTVDQLSQAIKSTLGW